MKIKIGLFQMEIIDGDKAKNLANALKGIQELLNSHKNIDIICLPELFTTGYDLRNARSLSEEIPGETIQKITQITKGKCIFIGSILEKECEKYYNTAIIIGKDGSLIGKYRKIHLFSPMLEKEFLTPGDKISIFSLNDLSELKIGLAICYDLRFPEIFRMMAVEGANIIFVPSEFPDPKEKVWKTLIHARAIENQCFIIGVNRIGKGKTDSFFGTSLISNGYNVIHNQGHDVSTAVVDLDLDFLEDLKNKLPLLKDRRVDLYKL